MKRGCSFLFCSLAGSAVVVTACGCGCGARPSPNATRPSASTSALDGQGMPVSAASAGAGGVVSSGMPEASFVLDDPRLASARSAVDAGDSRQAAQAVNTAIEQLGVQGDELARWRYVQATLLRAAGDLAGAAASFDAAAAVAGWSLGAYARWGAAGAYASLGRHQEVLDRTSGAQNDLPVAPSVRLLRADALDARGSSQAALEIWRGHLASHTRGQRWAEVSVKVAEVVERGGADPGALREACELARAVLIEAPAAGVASRAREVLQKAAGRLPEPQRGSIAHFTPEERVVQAQAWLNAGRRDEAVRSSGKLLDEFGRGKNRSKVACDASVIKATALSRSAKRAAAADAFRDAIEHCENDRSQLAVALLQGAKQASLAARTTDAIRLSERLEKDFAHHSFADDARLRLARLALLANDEQRFSELLWRMPDDYPDGDMVPDGLFELALHRMIKADWAGSAAVLERSLALHLSEKNAWASGRAKYFLARARWQLGREQEAREGWREVIRDYPFSYYMVQAYSRLAAQDPRDASDTLHQRESSEEQGELGALPSGFDRQRPAFVRAIELLRVGEPAFGHDELKTVRAEGQPNSLSPWAAAGLMARSGASEFGFRDVRGRVAEWAAHFPAGKWRQAWELAYPRAFRRLVDREAERAQIPPPLAYAIMREESAFDPDAVSPANAFGLMQLILPTAKQVGGPLGMVVDADSLRRPEVNVVIGCRFLASLWASFSSAHVFAVPSYNAGPAAIRKWLDAPSSPELDLWIESIPFEETRNYTKRVLSSMAVYGYLYDGAKLDEYLRVALRVSP